MKNRLLLKTVLLSVLALLLTATITAQSYIGKPKITNYSYKEYGAAPVNWWATEDNQGIMYFANVRGVLQYDGENWRLIRHPDQLGCRAVVKSEEDGRIYAAFGGDMGYLDADEHGDLQFVSLNDKIPEEYRELSAVWEADYWNKKIYFRTVKAIYIWDGENMKVIPTDDDLHVGNIVNDEFYLRIWNRGLCKLEGDSLVLVPGGERFADERIYTILPYGDDVLIGTRTMGFFIYDGASFTEFDTEIDEQVNTNIYLPGTQLKDGRYVINTFSNGAYVMDADGKHLQSITLAEGLQSNSVTFVYVDSRGVLWLVLRNGISSIDLNSKVTYMNKSDGLPADATNSLYKWKGTYYAGTINGVYSLREGETEFKRIPGTYGEVRNFIEHRGRLYAGSEGMGFLEILDADSHRMIRPDDNYDFRVSFVAQSNFDPNRFYIFRHGGLATMYFDENRNDFVQESLLDGYPFDRGAHENDLGHLWISGREGEGLIKVIPTYTDGRIDLAGSERITYVADKGLPKDGFLQKWIIKGELHVFHRLSKKSFLYDREQDLFVEKEFDYRPYIKWAGGTIADEVTDQQGRSFFNPGSGVMMMSTSAEGETSLSDAPFAEIKDFATWEIYVEEQSDDNDYALWFSGVDGIVRYSGDLEDPYVPDLKVNIRGVQLNGDSTVYGGSGLLPDDIHFDHDHRSVTINYAAPFYVKEESLRYQTRMAGLDDGEWSQWTTKNEREYLNLSTGNYTFDVRAKSVFGNISDEASFSFHICPPWYASWWAYLLYALGALAGVYGIVKSRTRTLKARQRELEAAVDERTAEVQLRVNELATVNDVSRAMTEKLEFDDLIQLVGDKLKDLFKADIAYLAILDSSKGIINFPYQHGDEMPPMQYGEGLTSKIIHTGEAILINKNIDDAYEDRGIKRVGKAAASFIGVPIPVEGDIVGVISVQSTTNENRFKDTDRRLLSTIARNVGIALHNSELYEEAKAAKAAAEDANEAKSAFLSTVSHELRTPLTSVLGFAKIIRKRLEDKIFPAVTIEDQKIKKSMKQVSENLNVVVAEGERLTTLINDVLDLAKIESGRMDWNMKPVLMQDIISRAVSSTSSLFDQKELALEQTIPEDLPLVKGDQDKLIQVVINLLSNAVKFTDKGKVTVDAYTDDGQIIVEVHDTGIGIADEDKSKVFERFRQAGDTLTDKPKGTGLGLPICREIIEKHGGIIWMKSEHGVGSTFFFSLPMIGDGAAHTVQLDRIVQSLKKQINTTTSKRPDTNSTILVVDDDTPIRSLLNQELTEAGYDVREAADGKIALDMIRSQKPDLIILDVMMPEINGFDVAAVLKNDPDTMDIPIIILSIVEDKERGLRIGVDQYLTKPIDTEKLFHAVDVLLEQGVSKKKVLVVDDNASTIETLSGVLKTRGYNVLDTTGANMVNTAVSEKPDIIMLNSMYNTDQETIKNLKFENGMENVLFFVYD